MDFLLLCMAVVVCFKEALAVGVPLQVSQTQQYTPSDAQFVAMVQQQVRDNPVIMYTGSRCSRSYACKTLMDDQYKGYAYHYMDVDTSPYGLWIARAARSLSGADGSGTVKTPLIFMCNQYLGGKKEFFQKHESGELNAYFSQCVQQNWPSFNQSARA